MQLWHRLRPSCYILHQACQRLLDQESKLNRSIHVLTGLILIAAGGSLFAQSRTVPKEFDHVRTLGRALSEFRDGRIQVVAAYYYSQANHDTPWLLIEIGALGEQVMEIERDGIELVTPRGRVVPLAAQARWKADSPRATLLLQQATPLRHPVGSYFAPANGQQRFPFFTLTGTVRKVAFLRPKELLLGDLLFESPTRLWDEGTYALVIRYDGAEAVLPIELR
jgi:hypothetical protein